MVTLCMSYKKRIQKSIVFRFSLMRVCGYTSNYFETCIITYYYFNAIIAINVTYNVGKCYTSTAPEYD